MGEPYNYPKQDVVSSCCGARIMSDSDICLDCGEHCGGEMYCEKCDNTGKINNEICPDCNGDGVIEVGLY